jgi:putative transposase
MPLSRKVAPYADRIGRAKSTANIMPVTNPLDRLNAEIKRRTDVVGIFPNEPAITRLVGALLLEQNDEWQLQRRYLQLEGLQSLADNQPARLSAVVS